MKRILLIFTVAIFCLSSHAQVRKGAIWLGGNIGGNDLKTKYNDGVVKYKENNLSASFLFGKAIKENLVLGVSALWAHNTSEQVGSNGDYKLNSWGGGVFLRKYKQLGNGSFSAFAHGSMNCGYTSESRTYGMYVGMTKTHSAVLGAYPGVSYAVSKKFQLEAGLNNIVTLSYESEESRTPAGSEEGKRSRFAFSSSIDNLSSLYLGFRIVLN